MHRRIRIMLDALSVVLYHTFYLVVDVFSISISVLHRTSMVLYARVAANGQSTVSICPRYIPTPEILLRTWWTLTMNDTVFHHIFEWQGWFWVVVMTSWTQKKMFPRAWRLCRGCWPMWSDRSQQRQGYCLPWCRRNERMTWWSVGLSKWAT